MALIRSYLGILIATWEYSRATWEYSGVTWEYSGITGNGLHRVWNAPGGLGMVCVCLGMLLMGDVAEILHIYWDDVAINKEITVF